MHGVKFSQTNVAKGQSLEWSTGMFDLNRNRHLIPYTSLIDASSGQVVVAMHKVKYGLWSPYGGLGDLSYQLNSFSGMIIGRMLSPGFPSDWSYSLPTQSEKTWYLPNNIIVDQQGNALSAVFSCSFPKSDDGAVRHRYSFRIKVRKNSNVYYVAAWKPPPWRGNMSNEEAIYVADSSFEVVIQQGHEQNEPEGPPQYHILKDCVDMEILLIWLLRAFYVWRGTF